jgi:type I restriction enzyme S subunit
VSYGYTTTGRREGEGLKFLRITDIAPRMIDWDAVPYCRDEPSDPARYRLAEGDIMIARTGRTTGCAKRLNKRHPPSVFGSYLVRVRPRAALGKHYIGLFVESDVYKDFVKRHLGGAAQPQANAQVLTHIDLVVPPASLLIDFDRLVQPMIDQKELLQIKNRKLRTVRNLLLPRLLSGHLDVEHLDIDVGKLV